MLGLLEKKLSKFEEDQSRQFHTHVLIYKELFIHFRLNYYCHVCMLRKSSGSLFGRAFENTRTHANYDFGVRFFTQ